MHISFINAKNIRFAIVTESEKNTFTSCAVEIRAELLFNECVDFATEHFQKTHGRFRFLHHFRRGFVDRGMQTHVYQVKRVIERICPVKSSFPC